MSIRRSTLDIIDDSRTDIPDFNEEDIRSSRYIYFKEHTRSFCVLESSLVAVLKWLCYVNVASEL
jgi:hypothetical protein